MKKSLNTTQSRNEKLDLHKCPIYATAGEEKRHRQAFESSSSGTKQTSDQLLLSKQAKHSEMCN